MEQREDEFIEGTQKVTANIGWLEHELSESTMSRLLDYIETAKKNPNPNIGPFSASPGLPPQAGDIATKDLVGHLSSSIYLIDTDDWFFKNTLESLITGYMEHFPSFDKTINVLTADVPWILDRLWVNFQKQHEFNPIHNHAGIFSFVIWIKIPTDWREQHALPISSNSNAPKTSNFEFIYTNILGGIEMYPYLLDKSAEGNMLFFPARLNHTVHPFYNSSEDRISISGNIKLDTRESTFIKNTHKKVGQRYKDMTRIT